ncbi:hypothetical protein [Methylobacterium nodulans]|uniref:Uncharacterized protein n=1 Tax=Methylobacterium nodulans (strain LMG 21967 / CNCM I-2342 / ORS 2060) TaxID=460265 RepID=B8IV44_METNO|nr:hypothetical protein [Methylobacterium nodulans]ACL59102.1 hypothetical protein Mnod_4226 [Methylobacterium nodulans ORS 2060]
MTIKNVIAHVECDRCRKDFTVRMETGDAIPKGWDLMDLATDAVRGGEIYLAPRETVTFDGCSVAGEGSDLEHLCPACTQAEDAKQAEAEHA